MIQPDRSVLIHEAGHAVVGAAVGWECEGLVVHDDGHCETRFASLAKPMTVGDAICVNVAGLVAQKMWGVHPIEAELTSSEDLCKIEKLLTDIGCDPDEKRNLLRNARRRARRILDKYPHRVDSLVAGWVEQIQHDDATGRARKPECGKDVAKTGLEALLTW